MDASDIDTGIGYQADTRLIYGTGIGRISSIQKFNQRMYNMSDINAKLLNFLRF